VKARPERVIASIARWSSIVILVWAFGCENSGPRTPSLSQQIERLTEENSELQAHLTESQKQINQLNQRVELLSSLPEDKRADAVYRIAKIKIGRYTGLFDENKDGVKETLIVYVQPIDETGDAIKAAGAVLVQLWDLGKEQNKALLAQWNVEPNELKKLWFESVLASNYRLKFDVSNIIGSLSDELTVKVTFTDYLSGRTFTAQKAIRP